jgi:AcrR family transcriptional regulator
MSEALSTRRGRKPRFTREHVLRTALGLVDAQGAAALSMRRVAAELGIEAMSLYGYVANRDELLDGLSELLVAEMFADVTGDDEWRAAVEAFARGTRRTAKAHPAAFELAGMRPLRTPAALGQVELLVGALRRGGLDPTGAIAAGRFVTAFARGYALADIAGFTLVGEDAAAAPPHLREAAATPDALEPDAVFGRALELVLAGIESSLPTQ